MTQIAQKTTRPTILLLRIFAAVVTFLPSRCLATKGYTYTQTNGRDIGSKPLRLVQPLKSWQGGYIDNHGDFVNLFLFFQTMESRLKTGRVDSTHIKELYLSTCIRPWEFWLQGIWQEHGANFIIYFGVIRSEVVNRKQKEKLHFNVFPILASESRQNAVKALLNFFHVCIIQKSSLPITLPSSLPKILPSVQRTIIVITRTIGKCPRTFRSRNVTSLSSSAPHLSPLPRLSLMHTFQCIYVRKSFFPLFCMGVKRAVLHWGKNINYKNLKQNVQGKQKTGPSEVEMNINHDITRTSWFIIHMPTSHMILLGQTNLGALNGLAYDDKIQGIHM
jgi:hypothetical protein